MKKFLTLLLLIIAVAAVPIESMAANSSIGSTGGGSGSGANAVGAYYENEAKCIAVFPTRIPINQTGKTVDQINAEAKATLMKRSQTYYADIAEGVYFTRGTNPTMCANAVPHRYNYDLAQSSRWGEIVADGASRIYNMCNVGALAPHAGYYQTVYNKLKAGESLKGVSTAEFLNTYMPLSYALGYMAYVLPPDYHNLSSLDAKMKAVLFMGDNSEDGLLKQRAAMMEFAAVMHRLTGLNSGGNGATMYWSTMELIAGEHDPNSVIKYPYVDFETAGVYKWGGVVRAIPDIDGLDFMMGAIKPKTLRHNSGLPVGMTVENMLLTNYNAMHINGCDAQKAGTSQQKNTFLWSLSGQTNRWPAGGVTRFIPSHGSSMSNSWTNQLNLDTLHPGTKPGQYWVYCDRIVANKVGFAGPQDIETLQSEKLDIGQLAAIPEDTTVFLTAKVDPGEFMNLGKTFMDKPTITVRANITKTTNETGTNVELVPGTKLPLNNTPTVFDKMELMSILSDGIPFAYIDKTSGVEMQPSSVKLNEYKSTFEIQMPDGSWKALRPEDGYTYRKFVKPEEPIGYVSKPEYYSEIKTGRPNSEPFEAMAGTPTTEDLYFASGGSEFIVDMEVEYKTGTATRNYTVRYNNVVCDKSFTIPCTVTSCPGHGKDKKPCSHHGCSRGQHYSCGSAHMVGSTFTGTQKFTYDYIKIKRAKVWQLQASKVDGLMELADTDVVRAEVNGNKIFYNIASSESSAGGRFRYSLEPAQHDSVVWNETSSNSCATYGTDNKNHFDGKYKELMSDVTVFSDFIVLRTSSGDQSVLYWTSGASAQKNISWSGKDSTLEPKMLSDTGDKEAGLAAGWYNNPLTAAKWKPEDINVGGYNGKYSTPKSKYKGTGKSNTNCETLYSQWRGVAPACGFVSKPPSMLDLWETFDVPDTKPNGEYITGKSKVFYELKVDYGSRSLYYDENSQSEFDNRKGQTYVSTYSKNHGKVNDVVIHDPVSVQYAFIRPLPAYRDQRAPYSPVGGYKEPEADFVMEKRLKAGLHNNLVFNGDAQYASDTRGPTYAVHWKGGAFRIEASNPYFSVPAGEELRQNIDVSAGDTYVIANTGTGKVELEFFDTLGNSLGRGITAPESAVTADVIVTGMVDNIVVNNTKDGWIPITRVITDFGTGGQSGAITIEGESGGTVTEKVFQYTGTIQHVTLGPGEYRLEAWGGAGNRNVGKGGYSSGVLKVTSTMDLYVGVGGGNGNTFNGGGSGHHGYGGGATHFATADGLLASLASNKGSVLLVAGGAGGTSRGAGGAGGGANMPGGTGGPGCGTAGSGATVSAPGSQYYSGSFGQGGSGSKNSVGGGGGYYGGGASYESYRKDDNDDAGGGGGSGFADTSKLTEITGKSGIQSGNGMAKISLADTYVPDMPYKIQAQQVPPEEWYELVPVQTNEGLPNKKPASFTGEWAPGNFINIDYPFQMYFPDLGDFYGNGKLGIGSTTSQRGKGFINDMNTTEWTKRKWVVFPYNVIYEGKMYKAGEDVVLYDKEEGIGTAGQSDYDFYCPLNNNELISADVQYFASAINNNENSLEGQAPTNKIRYGNLAARHNAFKNMSIDVVGRIGNQKIVDTGDLRFANLFKENKQPLEWLVPNLIHRVDASKQKEFVGDTTDIRGSLVGLPSCFLNTYGYSTEYQKQPLTFPLTPNKNNITTLQKQPMRIGYSALMDVELIGDYKDGCVTVIPYYYDLNLSTGAYQPVDVYMKVNGEYKPINYFGNYNIATKKLAKPVYDNKVFMSWTDEKERRNADGAEGDVTNAVADALPETIITDVSTEDPVTGNITYATIEETVPGTQPKGSYWSYGNNQVMQLEGRNRTYLGSSATYGNYKNPGNRLGEIGYAMRATKWHYHLGLPSSAVVVPKGTTYDPNNVEAFENTIKSLRRNNHVILATTEIIAYGSTYVLETDNNISGNSAVEIGTETYDLSGIPQNICYVMSANKSSKDDMDMAGTH